MTRAAAAMSAVTSPSQHAASVRPCRRAFCAARALPSAVRGPVLLCAFWADRSFPFAARGPVLLRAFCADRSLPSGVRGPVLLCALARLAASFAALVMPAPLRARGAL